MNAALAQWLIAADVLPGTYLAVQGHRLQRAGRIHVEASDDGRVWIGGDVTTVINGTVDLSDSSDRLQ